MENASKALIMAATVLLGVMIMSIGVALFTTFSDFSADAAKKMQEKQISEWNNNYLKYYGTTINDEGNIEPIKVTAHDIVSVINSAIENNIYYFGNDVKDWPSSNPHGNYYYVQVKIDGVSIEKDWYKDESKKTNFLSKNSLINVGTADQPKWEPKYYQCKGEPEISSITKRVYSINFEEIK